MQAELAYQTGVSELCLVAREGEERELAKLELLGWVEGWKALLLLVSGVETVSEKLEVGVVGRVLGIVG